MRNNTKKQKRDRKQAKNCTFCGCILTDTGKVSGRTLDHFYPLSKHEGVNRYWNKVVICKKCNMHKGDSDPVAYAMKLERQIATLTRIKSNVEHQITLIEPYYNVKDII